MKKAEEDIRRYSLDDINAMVAAGDYTPTPDDAPVYDIPDDFVLQDAVDDDVLAWFARHGGWQRINDVLRSFIKESSS